MLFTLQHICGEVSDVAIRFLNFEIGVLYCIVLLTQGSVPFIIERAVWLLVGPKKLPHLLIAPIKNREYAHKFWPARAALTH